MAKKTKEHRHCVMCGKVISSSEYLCSEKCEKEFQKHQKRAGKRRTIFMVLFIAMLAVFIIIAISGAIM